MDDVVPPLFLELMLRFRVPTPGVRISEIKVPGFSAGEVNDCFLRLNANGIIFRVSCSDSSGARYRGQLVGLSRLGEALLCSLMSERQLGVRQLEVEDDAAPANGAGTQNRRVTVMT
ncbi:hypothetical protein D3C71_1573980 [compost metagenome]